MYDVPIHSMFKLFKNGFHIRILIKILTSEIHS